MEAIVDQATGKRPLARKAAVAWRESSHSGNGGGSWPYGWTAVVLARVAGPGAGPASGSGTGF
jgi:hypothetical protein